MIVIRSGFVLITLFIFSSIVNGQDYEATTSANYDDESSTTLSSQTSSTAKTLNLSPPIYKNTAASNLNSTANVYNGTRPGRPFKPNHKNHDKNVQLGKGNENKFEKDRKHSGGENLNENRKPAKNTDRGNKGRNHSPSNNNQHGENVKHSKPIKGNEHNSKNNGRSETDGKKPRQGKGKDNDRFTDGPPNQTKGRGNQSNHPNRNDESNGKGKNKEKYSNED